MIRERLGTGLAAAALSTLVLVMVLVAGWFGAGRLGGLFGPAPSSGGARVVLVNPDLDLPGTPGDPAPTDVPAAPPETTPAPPPAPDLDPTPPDPDSPPAPESPDPGTAPPPAPSAAEPGAVVNTVESVVTLTSATVGAVGSTLGDTVAVALGLLTSPPDDAPVTAADVPTAATAETGEMGQLPEAGPPAAGPAPAAAGPKAPARPDPEGPAQRGRGLPTSPRIPALPR